MGDTAQRETTSFKLSNGDELVVRSYMTMGENRKLQGIILREADALTPEQLQSGGVKGTNYQEAQDYSFKTLIVSVNGKIDGQDGFSLLGYLMALPSEVGKEVVKFIDEISYPTQKKTS